MAIPKMSIGQYAALKGCSVMAVTKAIKTGRISAEEIIPPGCTRKRFFIDPVLADAEWIRNTRGGTHNAIDPVTQITGIKKSKKLSPEQLEALEMVREAQNKRKAEAIAQRRAQKVSSVSIDRNGLASKTGPQNAPQEAKTGDGEKREPTLHERKLWAEVRKAEAIAEREEIDLAKGKLELLIAEQVEDTVSEMIATARDQFLHLSNNFRVTFQEAPPEQAQWIEERITAILKSLSDSANEKI